MPNALPKQTLHVSKWYPQTMRTFDVIFCASVHPYTQTADNDFTFPQTYTHIAKKIHFCL